MVRAERLDPERAVLVVVDVQEAFRPAIDGFDAVVEACAALIQGARVLDLPIIVTEQYPQGLGDTVPERLAIVRLVEGKLLTHREAASIFGLSHQRSAVPVVIGKGEPEFRR